MAPAAKRWGIEVFKMAFYVFFPIITYTVFSNPEIFEDAIVENAKMLPKVNYEDVDLLERIKDQKRREYFESIKRSSS